MIFSLAARDGGLLRAYGEMVDVLCRENHREAALQLEHLWNRVAIEHPLSLRPSPSPPMRGSRTGRRRLSPGSVCMCPSRSIPRS